MRRIAILTVLITGLLSLFFYFILTYFIFGDFGFIAAGRIIFASNYGYIDYLLLPIGILVGMKIYRNRVLNGSTFRKLLHFGLLTTIQAAVLFCSCIFTYLQFVEPEYFDKLITLIKQLEISGKDLTSIEKEILTRGKFIEKTELFRIPLFYATANFFAYSLIGTISSILLARMLNRKKAVLKTSA